MDATSSRRRKSTNIDIVIISNFRVKVVSVSMHTSCMPVYNPYPGEDCDSVSSYDLPFLATLRSIKIVKVVSVSMHTSCMPV